MSAREGKQEDSIGIRRWACFVGVNDYAHVKSLRFCAHDASELHNLLVHTPHSGYADDRSYLLLGETRESLPTARLNILKQIQEMANQALPEDMILFYFAGHGQYTDDEVYLLTTDTEPGILIPDTAIPLKRITKLLDASQAHAKVIILDACYSGVPLRYGLARRSPDGPDSETMARVLSESQGTAILSSAARSDEAFELESMRHGVFTYYLLQGLRGAATHRPDRGITVNEIHHYVDEHVRQWARQNGLSMRPTMEFRGFGELTLITIPAPTLNHHTSPHAGPATSSPPIRPLPITFSSDAWLAPIRTPHSGWIGREADLRRLLDLILNTTDMAIHVKAGPGMGKTSMLNRIKHEIEALPEQPALVISLPTFNLHTCDEFAAELWEGLARCVDPEQENLSADLYKLVTFTKFGLQLNKIRRLAPGATFVVLLDNFDVLFDQSNDLELRRITGLMAHLIQGTPFPIVFLCTVARDIPGRYASAFSLHRQTLNLFDRAETSALLQELLGSYVSPTPVEMEWAYEQTGGHPYLTRLLAAKLLDQGPWPDPESGVSQQRLDQAADAALTSDRAALLFIEIYGSLLSDDQQRILLQFACGSRSLILSEIRRALWTPVKELTVKEYLVEVEEGVFMPRVRLFIDWLRHWSEFAAELDRLDVPCEQWAHRPPPLALTAGSIPSEGIYVDRAAHKVYVEGQESTVALTDLQYRALLFMAARKGQFVSYDDLAEELWPDDFHDPIVGMDNQRIPSLISRLRLALNDRKKPYKYLITLPKRGYRIEHVFLG